MKKNYLMMAAFATALAFTACSNEDEMPVVNEGNGTTVLDPESVIEIAISNTGTGTTRAARPVGSSEAYNIVNKVQLKVFDADGSAASVTFLDKKETNYSVTTGGLITFTAAANDGPNSPGDESHPNQEASIQVQGLTDGQTYTIVAYGYNGAESATDDVPYGGELQGTSMYYSTGDITNTTGFEVEEIFAGSAKATAQGTTTTNVIPNEEDGQTTITETVVKFASPVKIELTRQVAGMLAYLKNVPKYVGESEVRSVTVDVIGQSTGFYFPASLYGKETTVANGDEFNGIGTTYASTSQLLKFTIDENQAIYYVDENGDKTEHQDGTEGIAIYDFTKDEDNADKGEGKRFQMADNMIAPEGLVCADNTLIGGLFILPFSEQCDNKRAADQTGDSGQKDLFHPNTRLFFLYFQFTF